MNMFKPTKAKTVTAYLAAVPEARKKDVRFLHDFIRKTVPSLRPHFASNMLGYGSFPYRNYKNEAITWPVIALANQKQYISLYVCAVKDDAYLAELHKKDLGKVDVGKSCIRLRRVADVHLPALAKLLREAAASPGLASQKKG